MNTHRHQSMSRGLVRPLGFWLPLMVFLFSFVAGDSLHSSTCAQEGHLKWALHCGHAQWGDSSGHHIGDDVDCAACAFGDVAFVPLCFLVGHLVSLSVGLTTIHFLQTKLTFIPSFCIARGPPPLFS